MNIPVKCPLCEAALTLEILHLDNITCPACHRDFKPAKPIFEAARKITIGMAKRFKWVLYIAFASLPIAFVWLKFKGVDFVAIGSKLEVDLLLQFSMGVYFFSWCFGAGWETNDMEAYYAIPPNLDRIPLGAYAMIGILLGFGGVLLFFVHSFTAFVLALAVFWLSDYAGWMYLRFAVKPYREHSLHLYQELKEYGMLESLYVFIELNQGAWKWWRYVAGLLMLAILGVLALSPLSKIIGDAAGGMPPDVVLALSVLFYVLAIEGWIWFKRIRARNCYRLIETLSEKYDWSPKTVLKVAQPTR